MNDQAWLLPENPDPSEIIDSTLLDRREGRYAVALAKHVWFFQHALEYDPYLSGVRLSFGLGYWRDLASVYPPADVAFRETRDEAEAKFLVAPRYETFADVVALNRELKESARSVELFLRIAAEQPDVTEKFYHIAEEPLVQHERFQECAPYLHPNERVESLRRRYQMMKEHEESSPATEFSPPKVAAMFYYKDIVTLVVLLVHNDRQEDAQWVHDQALEVVDNERFRSLLQEAMHGHFPVQIPRE